MTSLHDQFLIRPEEIRAIIFDFGEVLCHRAPCEDFAPLAAIMHITPQRFIERYLQNRLPYDRGDMTPGEYWTGFGRETNITIGAGKVAELERLDLALWWRMDPVLIDWAGKLRAAGIKTGVVSNMFLALATQLRASAPWMKQFDAHTFSSEIRVTKPDPEIYRHNLRQLGVNESQALFLDDHEENVIGARSIGMQGLRFTTTAALIESLAAANFPVLPDAGGVNPSPGAKSS